MPSRRAEGREKSMTLGNTSFREIRRADKTIQRCPCQSWDWRKDSDDGAMSKQPAMTQPGTVQTEETLQCLSSQYATTG